MWTESQRPARWTDISPKILHFHMNHFCRSLDHHRNLKKQWQSSHSPLGVLQHSSITLEVCVRPLKGSLSSGSSEIYKSQRTSKYHLQRQCDKLHWVLQRDTGNPANSSVWEAQLFEKVNGQSSCAVGADSTPFSPLWWLLGSRCKKCQTPQSKANGQYSAQFWRTDNFTQIEAIPHSRPNNTIIMISTDPQDSQVLTPGHFLKGGPLTALSIGSWMISMHPYRNGES